MTVGGTANLVLVPSTDEIAKTADESSAHLEETMSVRSIVVTVSRSSALEDVRS